MHYKNVHKSIGNTLKEIRTRVTLKSCIKISLLTDHKIIYLIKHIKGLYA